MKQFYMNKYACQDKIKNLLEEDYHRSMIKIGFNLNDKVLVTKSIEFLKSKDFKISRKENLMLLSTKNKLLKAAINFIK